MQILGIDRSYSVFYSFTTIIFNMYLFLRFAFCYTAIVFHSCSTFVVFATRRPGSPDWDSLLKSPIIEEIPAPSISTKSYPIESPRQYETPEVSSAARVTSEWYAKKPLSNTPRAIAQRERLAKLKREDYKGYLEFRKKKSERNRIIRTNLTEEKKNQSRVKSFQAHERFKQRQKHLIEDPKNVDLLEKIKAAQVKASKKYQDKLRADVLAGTAAQRRLEIHTNRLIKKAEASRLDYQRKKVKS
jgi:hypothetical protein